jgi:hypothetical protein
VRAAVRNGLAIAGCLAALAVAGLVALLAMRSASVPPTQLATATVVVNADAVGGTAQLTVVEPVRFPSGGGSATVPAGTSFTTTNALLTGALGGPNGAPVGVTLSCQLKVRMWRGAPVIDVVRCAPAGTSPRG